MTENEEEPAGNLIRGGLFHQDWNFHNSLDLASSDYYVFHKMNVIMSSLLSMLSNTFLR